MSSLAGEMGPMEKFQAFWTGVDSPQLSAHPGGVTGEEEEGWEEGREVK